jgi:hypothetical protein
LPIVFVLYLIVVVQKPLQQQNLLIDHDDSAEGKSDSTKCTCFFGLRERSRLFGKLLLVCSYLFATSTCPDPYFIESYN